MRIMRQDEGVYKPTASLNTIKILVFAVHGLSLNYLLEDTFGEQLHELLLTHAQDLGQHPLVVLPERRPW
jgi:hypothetical protein